MKTPAFILLSVIALFVAALVWQRNELAQQRDELAQQLNELAQQRNELVQLQTENQQLKNPVKANAIAHMAFQDAELWRKELVTQLYANMTDADWDTAARWKQHAQPNAPWRTCSSVYRNYTCSIQSIEAARLQLLQSNKTFSKEEMLQLLAVYAYHSTGLEGNTLTLPETLLIIDGKKLFGGFADEMASPSIGPNVIEIRNLQQVMESLDLPVPSNLSRLRSATFMPITEQYLTDVNAAITRELGVPFGLRMRAAAVGFQKVLLPMPDELPVLLQEYVHWLSTTLDSLLNQLDPLTTNVTALEEVLNFSCDAHTRFVHIHPFSDGNGRLARIISAAVLQRFGIPGSLIKKENRFEYMNAVSSAVNDGHYTDLCGMYYDGICEAIQIFNNLI